MTVIILIIVGTLALGIGIYVYSTYKKEGVIVGDKSEDVNVDIERDSLPTHAVHSQKKTELNRMKESFLKMKTDRTNLTTVIKMAIADDVLTIAGREHIKQAAINRGIDYEVVLNEVEKHVRFLEIDTDTKLVDLYEKNRIDFETLISHKFSRVLFNIKESADKKYVEVNYSENPSLPEFLVEFIGFEKNIEFAVKCKWEQRTHKNGLEISSPEQLNLLIEYAKEKEVPVFIVLGLEGKGGEPERIFIVPLKNISKPFMLLFQLKKYEKMVGANFYFDYIRKELK